MSKIIEMKNPSTLSGRILADRYKLMFPGNELEIAEESIADQYIASPYFVEKEE